MQIGIIVVVVVLVFAVYRASRTHFVCPKCGKSFKVNILKYILAPHSMGSRLAKCPECGYSGMMMPHWDKKQS